MLNAFLLTRQWRDTREGIALDFWWATEQGACWTQITQQEIVFFDFTTERFAQSEPFDNLNKNKCFSLIF